MKEINFVSTKPFHRLGQKWIGMIKDLLKNTFATEQICIINKRITLMQLAQLHLPRLINTLSTVNYLI